MKIMKWLAISLYFHSGWCLEGNKNTDQLCQSHWLREQLNMNDGEREACQTLSAYIALKFKKQPTEINKIKEFELVTAYKKCLELPRR